MKYAYYPGCSLHSTAKEYDVSTKAICRALDIELQEIPDWVCCGASAAHMTSNLLSIALPVRDLITSREMGLDTAVCCAACYSRLRVANETMKAKPDETVSKVDQIVGQEYRGEAEDKHLLEIVAREYGLDALREKVTKDLSDLKVAAYYGCLLVRPPEVVAFDDHENPTVMEDLIGALGAEAVDWPHKTECCGASLALTTRTDVALSLIHRLLQMATEREAECLLVACPLCQGNLDLRQGQINDRYGTSFALPVVYFTQLIGLALGMNWKDLGLAKHVVSPKKLLQDKGLI